MKIIYVVSEDWFFCSHFIERAAAAVVAGYEVSVITHVDKHADVIRLRGIKVIPFYLDRRSSNPFRELGVVVQIWRAYKDEKPDIVHHVALKPVLYGTIAARLLGIKSVVNAPVGMGYVFISTSIKARLLRGFVASGLKFLLNPKGSKVIFENSDDLSSLVNEGYVARTDAILIKGAGIDTDLFRPTALQPRAVQTVVLTARMLWDKGVGEFVQAARILKERGAKVRMVLVGAPDPLNRASVSEKKLSEWNDEGAVVWLGFRSDIREIVSDSDIVCLPSYREGLPKSLLEAMSCGKPIVTTDVPGCREAVRDGLNGLLVPARNAEALAGALYVLLGSPEMRATMGAAGRKRAEEEFSQTRVISETLQVYRLMS